MDQFQRKPIRATNKNTTENKRMKFEVLIVTMMKMLVFRDVILHFVGSYSFQNSMNYWLNSAVTS